MKVTVIPVVISLRRKTPKCLVIGLGELKIRGRAETIQTTALLRLATILRRIFGT